MSYRRICAVALALALLPAAVAQAAFTFEFSPSLHTGPAGSTVNVDLFLVDDLDGQIAAENGLSFVDFSAAVISGPSSYVGYTLPDYFTANSPIPGTGTDLIASLYADFDTAVPDLDGRVKLITITYLLQGDEGQSTLIEVDLDLSAVFTWDDELSGLTTQTLTLTIIPEPATMLLAGAGLLLMARRRRCC
jgi:hypothetical protein